MGKTKKDTYYSYHHTNLRLMERYNMSIFKEDYDYLCNKIIQNDNITLIETEPQKKFTQYIYDLVFKRRIIRVVWNDKKQCITTVLRRGIM